MENYKDSKYYLIKDIYRFNGFSGWNNHGYYIILFGDCISKFYFNLHPDNDYYKLRWDFGNVGDASLRHVEIEYECDTVQQMDEYLDKLRIAEELAR